MAVHLFYSEQPVIFEKSFFGLNCNGIEALTCILVLILYPPEKKKVTRSICTEASYSSL